MAEFILDIPEPVSDDPEAVVTALETAAIFSNRGDGPEALRWLKRAAESSSEYGADVRTLALARAAADLSTQLAGANKPSSIAPNSDAQRRLPKPPSRPSTLRPAVADAEQTPSIQPARSSLRPPPPSGRSNSPTPPQVYETRSDTHVGTNGSSVRPLAQSFRPSQPAPEIRSAPEGVGLRSAARVSVLSGGDQPGVFIVRVLEEGESAQAPALEAFLVLSDPNARINR